MQRDAETDSDYFDLARKDLRPARLLATFGHIAKVTRKMCSRC
jgi:hypothetical protein